MRISPDSRPALLPLLLASAALLAACAPATRVTLLPQPGSAVEVQTGERHERLDEAYQTLSVSTQSEVERGHTTARAVERRMGKLLAAAPAPAQRYALYFHTGSVQLTPESEAELDAVLAEVSNRPGAEIIVTGHTDTVGSLTANDELSLNRARRLREDIIAKGFPAARIEAVGRGERELLVPTEDGVDEPRNRRVEIKVY